MVKRNHSLPRREACLESKELTSLEVESEAEHEEDLKEEATVEAFRALKKCLGDQHLAIRRRSQPKKWTQANGGSQQKLATTHRRMTHHAGVA
jgi:hypothetical protein